MAKRTIAAVDVAGRRVLMRVDFNVPLDEQGRVSDDRRIRLAMPSIRSVVDRGGRLVLVSHLGRPKGTGFEPAWSLRPAAERLRELLSGVPLRFVEGDCTGPKAAEAVSEVAGGGVVLLDNLRFNRGEKDGDPAFAKKLAAFGEVYCNDAFGTAHRPDASMVAVPCAMDGRPKVAGLLLEREIHYLSTMLADPPRPFVAVLGGAKVSDKLGAVRNLLGKVDTVLIGGAMAYTFLAAQGRGVGSSLVEPDMYGAAREILAGASRGSTALRLPDDHLCGRDRSATTPVEVFSDIPEGWMGFDLGPDSTAAYVQAIHRGRTIVWNGPVGVFEMPPFDGGTRQLAEAIARATGRGATTIVGGGDTAAAVESFGLADRFTHVSTGGGASLEMLEGKRFESVDLLDER
jgi:phosphoglycerate kinase